MGCALNATGQERPGRYWGGQAAALLAGISTWFQSDEANF
jgi:hypothetical protein